MKLNPNTSDVYLNCVARIEPDVTVLDRDAALASIAISLKRIADALAGTVDALEKKSDTAAPEFPMVDERNQDWE